jgi:transposase
MRDDVLHARAAGVDVGKREAVVCVRVIPPGGSRPRLETRRFPTDRVSLLEMRAWLEEAAVTRVLMEATGSYWFPLRDVLEDGPWEMVVANPAHLKMTKGRESDKLDAEALARYSALGIGSGSLMPCPEARDLRALTRERTRLSWRRGAVASSLEKVLERTGLKLSVVASDLSSGVSARAILRAVCAGESDPARLAALGSRLRATEEELRRALTGDVRDVDRMVIASKLDELDALDARIARWELEIGARAERWRHQIDLLCQIPGIQETTARVVIAETGGDMSAFPSGAHLASWAGVAPGINQSGGVSRQAGAKKGDKFLKAAFCMAASNARRVEGSFFQARYNRILRRHGRQEARVAVARSIAETVWAVLAHDTPYVEKGADWYSTRATKAQRDSAERWAVARLEDLGYEVSLSRAPAPPGS